MAADNVKEQSNILKARLDWAEETLRAMLYGEKPQVDPENENQSWLIEQMTRMYRAGFLCEEPESYITLPGEEGNEDIARMKGVTTREPLPKQLTSEVKDLNELFSKREISNFKVFGYDDGYRYKRDPLEQADDADAFILTKAGIMALYQWVRFTNAQIEKTADTRGKFFVIQNVDGFWNPTLRALSGVEKHTRNHFVTDTRHDTAEIIDSLAHPEIREREPKQGTQRDIIGPGTTVFMITGNRKKVLDYKKVFKRRGTDVNCVWFHQKFDKPEGADEFSYSYIGNLIEKINKMYFHVRDHFGPEKFRQALQDQNFDIENAVFWFDDSGLEIEEDLTHGPEFSNCTYRMNTYKKHGPGAEMKNAINAMHNQPFQGERSIRGMFKRLEFAANRLLEERKAAGDENASVSTTAIDRNCVAIVPIKEFVDAIENGASVEEIIDLVPMHFLQAATKQKITFDPRPNSRAMDSKNFLIPTKDPYLRTQAENTHYVEQHSITAQIVKAAARALGFEKHETERRSLSRKFDSKAGVGWRIGTQQTIHPDVASHGISRKTMKKLTGLYNFVSGKSEQLDLMQIRDHELALEDGEKINMPNALNNFHNFTMRMHGFLLTPDTKQIAGDDFFWHRAFTFFSLIVGRQINDKSITSKPLLIMDSPTWQPFIELLETYAGGLIPEMPHEIIDSVVKKKKYLRTDLDRAFSEYQPDEVPEYVFTEDGEKCSNDLFSITMYCSASTTDYPLKMWARNFAFDCGALGFAVKNGGGTGPDGLMIETSEGILKVKNDFDSFLKRQGLDGAPETHISSIQCVDTAQEEGLCKFNDYWAVYPTIYQRMHELQNADAEVVLPGGAGTIQEIAASVLMRKAGIYPIEHRPLIIVNHEGIYDPFLKMIPEGDFKLYNIKVVDTAEKAMKILLKARKDRDMVPDLPYTNEEYEKYKSAFERELRRQERTNRPTGHTPA